MLTANEIRDKPLAVPVESLIVQLRRDIPTMGKAHKVYRLKFAAMLSAIAESREARGLSAGDIYGRVEAILNEVGETLKPGWFAREIERAKAKMIDGWQ